MIARRGFLGAILAAGVAPAAVGSGILMPVRRLIVPNSEIIDSIIALGKMLDQQDVPDAHRVVVGYDFGKSDFSAECWATRDANGNWRMLGFEFVESRDLPR